MDGMVRSERGTLMAMILKTLRVKDMERFLQKYNLRPGDRIVTPRSGFRVIQHHAIYWGKDINGVHWILENQDYVGVRFIELDKFLKGVFEIKRIERFQGNDYERTVALKRGEKLLGRNYDLFNFNCEHFANYLQHGKSFSVQMENFGGLFKVAAGVTLFVMVAGSIGRN